jgi:hypothetical protein
MTPRDLAAEEAHGEFTGWMEAQNYSTHPDDCDGMDEAFAAGMQAGRDLAAAAPVRLCSADAEPKPMETPPGEPLTHFFHCWRFPAHHACAVALIERQSVENDRLLVRAANAERLLSAATHATGATCA